MEVKKNQKFEILFGNKLENSPPKIDVLNPACVLNGTINDSGRVMRSSVPMSTDLLSKHLLLLGGIGTGKTNAFFQIVSQLQDRMTKDDIMIIFDTKGDFYKEFYRPGDVVISNDDTATNGEQEDYWNLVKEIDDAGFSENAIEISKSLFSKACENTTQPFFPNAAKDLFYASLMYLHQTYDVEDVTNRNLINFFKGAMAGELKEMLCRSEEFRSMVSYISEEQSPQTQGVLSELQQVVREIFVGNFANHGDISIRDLVRRKGGKKVFIEYDLSCGEMLTPIYSLLFDLAIKEAIGRKHSEGNVYFITDEFRLLPDLKHIDDAVNFGRSLGVKFLIGVQNVEQIYDNYGEARARSILSGFSTMFAFRVNDAHTREYIQGFFGKNRKLESYTPTRQSLGMIEELREAEVIEDWEVSNLKTGEAIIGMPEHNPFKFHFDLYQKKGF